MTGRTWATLFVMTGLAIAALGAGAATASALLQTSSPDWYWQNPAPHGDFISGLSSQSKDGLFAVGRTQGFLRSADGGETWTANRTGPPFGFNAIAFANADNGFAVGESSSTWDYTHRAVMWRTSDGGETWSNVRLAVAESTPLGDVAFATASRGWVTGRWGTILSTSDGGSTWSRQYVPDEVADHDVLTISSASAADAWAIADRNGVHTCVLRTTDGGTRWSTVFSEERAFWAIESIDDQTAWMGGDRLTVKVTRDGGATWADADTPQPEERETITNIASFSASTGIAITGAGAQGGRILRTTDGGDTWSEVADGLGDFLDAVLVQGDSAWVGGNDGVLAVSHDAGATWTALSTGVRVPLGNASFWSHARGWVCGYGGTVLRTIDGGTTWTGLRTGTTANLSDVEFVTSRLGWIVGAEGVIRRTTDGGDHWRTQRSGTAGGLAAVDFVDKRRGWVAGQSGLVLRTTDGGKEWKPVRTHVGWNLQAVQFRSAKVGWVVGDKGVLRTTDGGAHWRRTQLRVFDWPPAMLLGVSFVSDKLGWACGIAPAGASTLGVIYHTTDGGRTWTDQEAHKVAGVQALVGISFADKDHGIAVGESGLYLSTTDGGRTWAGQPRPTPDEDLNAVGLLDATTGWAVGSGGTILKYAPER